jgi:uncharacterized membrane protein YeaQ/YmgE (transglycosylase-associated protein family)
MAARNRRRGKSWPALIESVGYPRSVLILGILAFGILVGWIARTLLGRSDLSWGRTILFGIIGSFIGGLIVSLIAGDGLSLRPSGIIGSIVGAILLILGDQVVSKRLRHQP